MDPMVLFQFVTFDVILMFTDLMHFLQPIHSIRSITNVWYEVRVK